jgi:hypothetical protein
MKTDKHLSNANRFCRDTCQQRVATRGRHPVVGAHGSITQERDTGTRRQGLVLCERGRRRRASITLKNLQGGTVVFIAVKADECTR